MKNELLSTAYTEIEKLKKESPSWEVYTRINALYGAILCLQKDLASNATTIDEVVNELVENYGENYTIEKIKDLLNSIKSDIDMIAPHVSATIIKKLREIKDNG